MIVYGIEHRRSYRTIIDELDIIHRVDPTNSSTINQTTVYLILKDEDEEVKYADAIRLILNIIDDERCPYENLVILHRTKDLMSNLGDKTMAAMFQENNVMVRLFNHYINYNYKYNFGRLPLGDMNMVAVEFLKFLSEAANENMISLKVSLWNYRAYEKTIEHIIEYLRPLCDLLGLSDEEIVRIWNENANRDDYEYYSIGDVNSRLREYEEYIEMNGYVSDVRLLPSKLYGRNNNADVDSEDVVIRLVPGRYRQKIDFEVYVKGNTYSFHLSTKAGNFIYVSILLAKYNKFNLLRAYFQHQKGRAYFRNNGRRCTAWMRKLFDMIIVGSGDFAKVYSQLAGGQYDYHTLNNVISKINRAIRESIKDPYIKDKCIIKSKGTVGETFYTVDLLPENIVFKCEAKDSNLKSKMTVDLWNKYLNDISQIEVIDERVLPENIRNEDLLDLSFPQPDKT